MEGLNSFFMNDDKENEIEVHLDESQVDIYE